MLGTKFPIKLLLNLQEQIRSQILTAFMSRLISHFFNIATLGISIKLVKIAVLCSLILTANSYTVLGFATDMAVLSVIHDGDNVDTSQEKLFLQFRGLSKMLS